MRSRRQARMRRGAVKLGRNVAGWEGGGRLDGCESLILSITLPARLKHLSCDIPHSKLHFSVYLLHTNTFFFTFFWREISLSQFRRKKKSALIIVTFTPVARQRLRNKPLYNICCSAQTSMSNSNGSYKDVKGQVSEMSVGWWDNESVNTIGHQPGVRENMLHQSKRNTETAWTLTFWRLNVF
jgi:hypothetical protein